jgi:hypothetical protein
MVGNRFEGVGFRGKGKGERGNCIVGCGDLTHPSAMRHPCLEKVLYLGKPQDLMVGEPTKSTFRSWEGNFSH